MTTAPLVVGIDGSDASARALRWALAEALHRAAPVVAIMVWESHAVLAGPAPLLMHPELAPREVHQRHQQDLDRVVSACLAGTTNPDVQVELVEGDTVDTLVDRSAEAAMLVLGDRGRSRVTEVLGGTALHCVHKARCPVLIVPSGMDLGRRATATDVHPVTRDPILG